MAPIDRTHASPPRPRLALSSNSCTCRPPPNVGF